MTKETLSDYINYFTKTTKILVNCEMLLAEDVKEFIKKLKDFYKKFESGDGLVDAKRISHVIDILAGDALTNHSHLPEKSVAYDKP